MSVFFFLKYAGEIWRVEWYISWVDCAVCGIACLIRMGYIHLLIDYSWLFLRERLYLRLFELPLFDL